MSKNKPIKSFDIMYLGTWYFIEIYSQNKIEVFLENKKNLDENKITFLLRYLKSEGFFEDIP